MKAVKIKNKTKRMLVVQLPRECAGFSLKARSETLMRYTETADGSVRPKKVRLRHGPVIRLIPGECTGECLVDVLRVDTIKELRKRGDIEVIYVEEEKKVKPPSTKKVSSKYKAKAKADTSEE